MPDETAVQASPAVRGDTYAEVNHHKNEAARLSALAKDRGKRGKAALVELEALRTQHADLAKKYAEISTRYREVTHKSEFAKAAKEAGVDPDYADDLWSLSGYSPVGDDPDPKAISAAIGSLKERRPRYFAPPKPADPKPDEGAAPTTPEAKVATEPAPPLPAGPPSAKGITAGAPPADPASRRAQILAARGTPDILRFPPAEIAEAYKSVGT